MKIIKLEAEKINKNHKNYFYLYFRDLEFQTCKFLKQLYSIKAN